MSSAGCTGRTQSAVAGICKPYAVERRFVVECCRARQTVRGVGVGWHVGGHIGGIVDGQGVYGPPPWGLPAADRFEEACRSMAKSVAKSAWVRSRAGAQAAGSWCDSQPCWTRRCSRYGARANIRAGARACSSRMTVTIGACILLSRCGVKSEAVSRSLAEGTTQLPGQLAQRWQHHWSGQNHQHCLRTRRFPRPGQWEPGSHQQGPHQQGHHLARALPAQRRHPLAQAPASP